MSWVIILGIVFVAALSGVWLAIALGGAALVAYHFLSGGIEIVSGYSTWDNLTIYTFAAIPCFILMGKFIEKSGVSTKIYKSLSPLMARFPGRLLHTNIVTCALFSAIFGASAPTAAAVGTVAIPEMRKRHYDDRLILGTVAAGGTLGIMIPPSAALIIYGTLTNTSIGALFAAGILPGVMTAIFMIAYIFIRALRNPEISPATEPPFPLGASLLKAVQIWPVMALIIMVLAPIWLGWATAVEASGIGVFGSLIVSSVSGKVSREFLINSVKETTDLCVMLFFVISGAMLLANAVAIQGLPRQLVMAIQGLAMPTGVVMIMIILIYISLGCLFDGISFMLMTLPFIYPIVTELGYGSIWFGIIIVIMIEVGQLTPPVGFNLYVVQAIAGKGTSIGHVTRSIWPFFLLLVLMCGILMAFPQITDVLPRLLGYEIN